MTGIEILAAIGGTAGVASIVKVGIDIYNAKSNKATVDVGNMSNMLSEAHKMFDKENERYNALAERFDKYQQEQDAKEAKCDEKIEQVVTKLNQLERTVTQAYRCKYPENIQDCPVVKAYEARVCDACNCEHEH